VDTQNSFVRFLVPVDFLPKSTVAFDVACKLARHGDEIELLHVLPPIEPTTTSSCSLSNETLSQRFERDAFDCLAQFPDPTPNLNGVAIQRTTSSGDVAATIVERAETSNANLIVLGTAAPERSELGHITDQVARLSTVPTLLLRCDESVKTIASLDRIYVPLDGSRRSLSAIPVASGLARHLNVPVHLVRVREIERSALLFGPQITASVVDELMASEAREIAIALGDIVDRLRRSGISATWSMLTGPVTTSLERDIGGTSLVVLSSRGRGDASRRFAGSVARHIACNSPSPVVLVPSFVHEAPIWPARQWTSSVS